MAEGIVGMIDDVAKTWWGRWVVMVPESDRVGHTIVMSEVW